MSLGKASIKRAAGAEKAASRKISGEKVAAESVISPMNAEEIQVHSFPTRRSSDLESDNESFGSSGDFLWIVCHSGKD